MDLLQYKQIEESLKYIEDYMLNKKYSDGEFDNMLKAFQNTDDVIDSGTNKWKIPSYYENGCSETQLNMIRGILLSADYNYGKFAKKLEPQKERIEKDVAKDTYKGRTLDDYENLRLEAIDKIKNTEGFAEKLQVLMGYSLVINEGLEKLAEYKLIKETVVLEKISDAAKKMINCGFSLTQISNYLQTNMLSVFYLAKNMGKPFKLSAEEEKAVKKAEEEILNKMAVLGEKPRQMTENNIPFSAPETWDEMVMLLKIALADQQNYLEIYSSSRLTPDMFMKDSDVVIDIKYGRPEYYYANTVFNIFAECLFPSGCHAVTNREHMLLYSKKSKIQESFSYNNMYCVYRNEAWNI